MEWIDGNLGSRLTMKYPAVYMMEPGARGEILSIAFASKGQHQDAGAKVVHCAPHTTSRIISRASARTAAGRATAAWCKVQDGAVGVEEQRRLRRADPRSARAAATRIRTSKSTSRTCRSSTRPASRGSAKSSSSTCMSRGLTEAEASSMIVSGFIEPLVKELPMEYAVEMNRLIELQMEGSVG